MVDPGDHARPGRGGKVPAQPDLTLPEKGAMCTEETSIHKENGLRTNIEIDDARLGELMALTGAKTKREAVNTAIAKQLEREKAIAGLLAMRGKVDWEGDIDAMRRDR